MFDVLRQFALEGKPLSCKIYGNGHINRTYLVVTDAGKRYILQRINNDIFKDVPGLMNNISQVIDHLRGKGLDERHALHLVPAVDGAAYTCYNGDADKAGYYRIYAFVEDSLCLDRAENAQDFYQSAVAFGTFQMQLADFPAEKLTDTIPAFHNTLNRVSKLRRAIEADVLDRAKLVQREIDFALREAENAGCMLELLEKGDLPLRVTHNDTKLNNVMLDAQTRAPLCVIDLDTVMPGLSGNDFGDSIRFGASTGAEDERDLDKIEMSLDLFRAYSKGFLSACGSALTPVEIETLPMGAKLMTYECGIRFLTDYLEGDTYFRIHRPDHNLDRTRTQFKLVADMNRKWDAMMEIIREETPRLL